MSDNVDHPSHYGGEDNPYEVIKVLRAWDLELAKGFCWGNVIKYTARAEKKGSLEDYKKADWYATELVSIEAELAGRSKLKPSEIPVVINGSGRYRLKIDWDKRTTEVVREDTQFVGGAGGAGGGGGSSATPGGNGGGGAGGEYSISGGLSSVTTVKRCNSSHGCVGGYHGRGCPLHVKRSGNG